MILYFKPKCGDALQATRFEKIAEQLALEVRFLEECDLEERIDDLLNGHRGQSKVDWSDCDSFLLFDLEDDLLDELLGVMREANLRFPLKARTTPSNVKWSLKTLIGHVSEEAELMKALHKLHQLFRAANEFTHAPKYPKEAWQAFEAEKEKVKAHLEKVGQEEISLEETLALTERFNQAVMHLLGEG